MTDSDWHIKGEFTENGVNNPLKHIRGALSMARDDDFDTAGTQFFVVHKDAAKLDGRYEVRQMLSQNGERFLCAGRHCQPAHLRP